MRLTGICASPVQHSPRHGIEPGENGGIATVGRGDQRVFEGVLTTLAAQIPMAPEQRHDFADEGASMSGKIGRAHV